MRTSELTRFQEQRIEALHNNVCELQNKVDQLKTFIIELTDSDCPEQYKNVILSEITNNY
tara:strand:- start:191 stop:370 length:180 start_codon:yes stop_codon:yes gene_type:complete